MGDQRLPENHPDWAPRYKSALNHKKEQLTFPPFMEGHHSLFSREKLEDFTRDYEVCKEILSRTIRETPFPRISHEAPSTATNKSQRKLLQDSGLFCSMSMDQQGRRRTQNKLDHLSQREDDAEEHFINFLQKPKHWWNLNKWPHLENQREANKNSKHVKRRRHRKFNLGNPENFRSFQRNLLPRNTSTNQNFFESLNYRYTQRESDDIYEWNEALGNSDALQEFDMDRAHQPTCKDSSNKKICNLPSKLKYFRGLSEEKDIRFSKQESIFEMKLQNPHDPCKSTEEKFKYGPSYQKSKQLKALATEEPITDPKSLLEIQGRSYCKPDIFENLYGPIAFKDFIIQKGYDMPVILKKFFMKKGWSYNSVNTPMPRILKNHELIMQKQDDEDDEGERGKELD